MGTLYVKCGVVWWTSLLIKQEFDEESQDQLSEASSSKVN